MSNKRFTPADLKYHVSETGSYFFTRKTMAFFGDTMANYGVRSVSVDVVDSWDNGEPSAWHSVEAWELYRKRPVKHGLQKSAYFDKTSFKQIHSIKE